MSLLSQPLVHHAQPHAGDTHEYHVPVRRRAYLWGSADIRVDVKFNPPLVLHVSNDTFGEPIRLGTHKANGTHRELGTLHPGEHFAIELHDISGVSAECDRESAVACAVGRA